MRYKARQFFDISYKIGGPRFCQPDTTPHASAQNNGPTDRNDTLGRGQLERYVNLHAFAFNDKNHDNKNNKVVVASAAVRDKSFIFERVFGQRTAIVIS